jgi:hypothetical protein
MQKWKLGFIAVASVGTLLFGSPAAHASRPKPGTQPDVAFTHVPVAQRVKMQAQDKARAAATRIHRAVELSTSKGFTGIELHQGAVRLWYKGTPLAAVRSAINQARGTAKVEVLPAEHSLTELQTASGRMVAHLRAHPGGPAHRVSIPVDGTGLVVGVDAASTPSTPSTASPESSPSSGSSASASSGLPDVGVPVQVVRQERVRPRGRYDDTAPFYGGGRIASSDGFGCTAGFGVAKPDHSRYLLTAGHCGYVGQTWLNGQGIITIGTVRDENVGQDLMLIAANAGQYAFTGVGTSGATGHVSGTAPVFTGEELCSSGFATTWLCGHVVIDAGNTSYCAYDRFGNWECYGGMVWSRQEDGAVAAHDGDSGGPVVLPTPTGLIAKGIISGAGGSDLVWQDFFTATQLWGVQPITQ